MERDLYLRPDLLAAGFTDEELLRQRRAGTAATVRPGGYVAGGDPRLNDKVARHSLLVHSTLPKVSADAVVSHVSAAVLHGLRLWKVPLSRVHITRDAQVSGRRTRLLHAHIAPLVAADVVEIGGLPVTSLARTVVDLARTVPFEKAVVIADGALAAGVMPEALTDVRQRCARWRGGPAAARVIAFADGRAESVGESRSRVAIARFKLPAPVLQWEVRDANGRFVARSDFGWPAYGVVGEFDGRAKYGRLLEPDQDPSDAVFAEKVREDDVRAQNLSMVRWIWPSLDDFGPVAARLWRAFAA